MARMLQEYDGCVSAWPCDASWISWEFCEQQSLPTLRPLSASPAARRAVRLFLPTCCLIYHPPDVRVRIRRFGGLSRPRHRDGSQAKVFDGDLSAFQRASMNFPFGANLLPKLRKLF